MIPSATPWSRRRRILTLLTVGLVIGITIVLVLAEVAIVETRPVTLISGNWVEGDLSSCYGVRFYTETTGTLTTSWTSSSNTTGYLVTQDQMHSGLLQGGQCVAGGWGQASWIGQTNVTNDSLSTHVGSETYYLLFVISKTPTTIRGTAVVLTPPAWTLF